MAIEKSDGGTMITGDDVYAYQMMAQIKALELEVRTGMKMGRGNLLKFCKDQYGLKSHNKKDAIVEMKNLFNQKFEVGFYKKDN